MANSLEAMALHCLEATGLRRKLLLQREHAPMAHCLEGAELRKELLLQREPAPMAHCLETMMQGTKLMEAKTGADGALLGSREAEEGAAALLEGMEQSRS